MPIATILTLLVVAAEPSPRPRVAVLGVRAEPGIAQGTANLLSDLLSTDLSHTDRYEVMTSADVATLVGLERQKQLLDCAEGVECSVELARALGAELVLDASVGAVGELRVLALRLYDAKKSKTLARESVTVEDESALVPAARGALGRLFATLGVTLPTPAPERSKAGWYVLGGGGALAVAGGILGALAWVDYQSFRASPFNDALGEGARGKGIAADSLFGAAIATGIVAVVLLLLPPSPPETPAASATEGAL